MSSSRSIIVTAEPRLVRLFLCLILYLMLLPSSASAFDRFTAHGGPVRDLALSPDGENFVTASFDYSAVLWSANDIKEKSTLFGHEAALNTAKFSPDGRWLATGGDDGLIMLWRTSELKQDDVEPIILRGHKGKIVHLAFSNESKQLASASWDGSIGLWQLENDPENTEVHSRFIRGHEGPVNAVQFSNDGDYLYSAGQDGQIRYWRLASDEYLRSVVRNGWGISVFAIDETKDIVAFGSSDGVMSVARLSDQTMLMRVGDERVPVLSLYWLVAA